MTDIEPRLRSMRHLPVEAAARRAAGRLAAAAESAGLLTVAYTSVDSPVGRLLVAGTDRGVVTISFAQEGVDSVLEELARLVSPRVLESAARLEPVRRELGEYFERRRTDFSLRLDWQLIHGFHVDVLRQTAAIPYGEVRTYKQVARLAGSPLASRAAGNALGSNPIPIVIPCHRVVRTGGGLGGYGGGLDKKELLLRLEGAWL